MGTFSVAGIFRRTGSVEKIKRDGVLYKPSMELKMNFSSFAASCKAHFDCLVTGQSTEQHTRGRDDGLGAETMGLEQSSASAGLGLSDVKGELRGTSRPL